MKNSFKNLLVNKGYKYLVLKLVIFFMIVFIADFFIGKLFSYFYFKQTSGWEYRTKYSVEDTKADILIFGASRAQQQYNPIFFEDKLNQSSYNVGRDGESIFYQYAILKAILKRYSPKMIILDIENKEFLSSQGSYDRLSALLPFYSHHPEMRPIIQLKSPYEKFKLLSKVYPYNSMVFKIAIGNTQLIKKNEEDIKGYLPLTRELDEPIRTHNLSEKYDIDSIKVNCYKAFIADCIEANVKLYLVCSPYFINTVGSDSSMTIGKEIAKANNIHFFDFSKDELFLKNSKLFDDTVHVNVSGSKIFSNQLIDSLIANNKN